MPGISAAIRIGIWATIRDTHNRHAPLMSIGYAEPEVCPRRAESNVILIFSVGKICQHAKDTQGAFGENVSARSALT